MKNKKTYQYSHPLNHEFFVTNYKLKPINQSYKYVNNSIIYKVFAFIAYRLIATPFAFIYTKLWRRIKFENTKALKQYKKQSYFVFANHTHAVADAFAPSIIAFPKACYAITNADNVSMPVLGRFNKMLGALPLPDDYSASKNFIEALKKRAEQNSAIIIYPEAHIWPYYTGIRPFTAASFKYPVKFNLPVFTFTTTYQTTKRGRLKTVIYIDGPFQPDFNLPEKSKADQLRNLVYQQMCARSDMSTYQKYNYIKIQKENNDEHNI